MKLDDEQQSQDMDITSKVLYIYSLNNFIKTR